MVSSPRPLAQRSWRYTVVGLICALSNYAIMLTVDAAGGHYLLGTVIALIIVTPLAYLMHSQFTFDEPLRWNAFMRFVGGVASAYPVATLLMVILCSGLQLSVAIATPIATIALFAWNFLTAHWAILARFGFHSTPAAADSDSAFRGH